MTLPATATRSEWTPPDSVISHVPSVMPSSMSTGGGAGAGGSNTSPASSWASASTWTFARRLSSSLTPAVSHKRTSRAAQAQRLLPRPLTALGRPYSDAAWPKRLNALPCGSDSSSSALDASACGMGGGRGRRAFATERRDGALRSLLSIISLYKNTTGH
eukprot:scaffold820_cov104-Isochrysis_galbana.AAC.11